MISGRGPRGRRAVALAVAAGLVVVAGVVVGPALTFQASRWWRLRSFGAVLSGYESRIVVPRDSRFALRWEQAVLPCMQWEVVDPVPDERLIRQVGRERIADPRAGVGSAGELFLLFATGEQAGQVELVLDNCADQGPAARESQFHERRTYQVTVT